MTKPWSIVMTGIMEHCDERAMGIVMTIENVMTMVRSIVITVVMEHCDDK